MIDIPVGEHQKVDSADAELVETATQ